MKFIRKNTKLFEEVSENFPKLNYVIHRNKWVWGRSNIIVTSDGCGLVTVSFENDMFAGPEKAAVLSGLSVVDSKRKSGYGRALVAAAEDLARKEGAKMMILWADKNDWVINWYKRLGYVESDYPRELEDGGESLQELEKKLV